MPSPIWRHPGSRGQSPLEPVIGDKDIYGDGSVIMLAMPGHAPGSYALLVRLARMGAGAAERRHRAFRGAARDRQRAPFNTDRAQSLASMDRLRHIVKRLKVVLVMQHDAAA